MLLPTHTPSSSGSAVGGYSLDGRISASDSLGNPVLPNENGGLGAENHDTYTVHMQQDTVGHYTTEGWRLPRLHSHATRVIPTSCLTSLPWECKASSRVSLSIQSSSGTPRGADGTWNQLSRSSASPCKKEGCTAQLLNSISLCSSRLVRTQLAKSSRSWPPTHLHPAAMSVPSYDARARVNPLRPRDPLPASSSSHSASQLDERGDVGGSTSHTADHSFSRRQSGSSCLCNITGAISDPHRSSHSCRPLRAIATWSTGSRIPSYVRIAACGCLWTHLVAIRSLFMLASCPHIPERAKGEARATRAKMRRSCECPFGGI